jgi:hypothetical protein
MISPGTREVGRAAGHALIVTALIYLAKTWWIQATVVFLVVWWFVLTAQSIGDCGDALVKLKARTDGLERDLRAANIPLPSVPPWN